MTRRSRAGGKPIKGRRRKAAKPIRRNAPKVQARSKLPPATEETEVARLTRELSDERKQRTATSEVLHLLSGSHGDLNRLFNTILTSATKLCQANFGTLSLYEGDAFRIVAMHDVPPALAELRRREPLVRAGPLLRIAETKRLLHIADYTEYVASHPADSDAAAFAKLTGVRTILEVPMLKDGEMVGAIVIYRQEMRTFSDREIELLESFAAQAVIAIENARLLNELRQRTTDLTKALQQQTATSEVLQVISSSPGDLEPVFATMLERAVRICDAAFGNIYRWDEEAFQHVAGFNTPPAFAETRRRFRLRPASTNPVGRMIENKAIVHVADLAQEREYVERASPGMIDAVEVGGVRTLLLVPMMKEEELVGAFAVSRCEVYPFTDKQIELVKNFAAQAVIAIENARLLHELRQRTSDLTERTTDLTEALEQQTATSEVLQVISGSPGDLQPVFATMLEKAVRICDAKFGTLYLFEDGRLRLMAAQQVPEFMGVRAAVPREAVPGGVLDETIRTKRTIQVADLAATKPYIERHPVMVEAVELGGIRTVVAVPMLKDDKLIGIITIVRQEVRLFTAKQIALVTNFAAQAVIAIENARLLNELRQRTDDLSQRTADLTEALEQQTATSEVLQVISSSPGDLEPVFATMLKEAVRICDAKSGGIYRVEGDAMRLVATHDVPSPYAEARRLSPFHPGPKHILGRMMRTKSAVQIADATTDPGYVERRPEMVAAVELGGVRTMLGVPLLKENDLVGVFALNRQEVRPFNEKQIALLTNFAAQAVIAIEDARLLGELRERTDQLAVQAQELADLNQQLERRVTDQVGEIERMGRLRRFLPPQVADLIVASGSEKQLESHRREITALFCDLRGFTGFSESADPEDVMMLLREYHEAIGESIIKYNGTLERYAGDGVMVVFNDPVPVENPALQGVLMALEMRDAIRALTETWRRWGHDIGFGIGIAHGFATLGTIGFEGRFDYAAIGTVSNVASRLCDEAKPGQILISPRVLTKVENTVKVEPVGEFELKGIRRPLAAYNVVAIQSSDA